MKCPKCNIGDLRVTNTYRASQRAATRSKVCTHCGQRFTETLILSEANRRGEGAFARASQLRDEEGATSASAGGPRGPSHIQDPV